jgi:hypothetical protein
MAAAVVFARQSCSVTDASGLKVRLVEGEVWAADDPLVRARPDFFSVLPPTVRRSGPAVREVEAPVEVASAEPGVKRAVKRASSK